MQSRVPNETVEGSAGFAGWGSQETNAIPLDRVPKWDFTADVVIVGYGAAGATAAITAKDDGANPLIIEKMSMGGGNSGVCAGAMLFPNSLAEAVHYYRGLSFGTVDEEMIQGFAEAIIGIPQLLKDLGAEFEVRKASPNYRALGGPEITYIQFNPTGVGGFKFLTRAVERRGIPAMFNTQARNLIQVPHTREIVGVRAEHEGKEIYVKAEKAVVLSCGGYGSNREMLEYYNFPGTTPYIFSWGSPGNTGDGLKLAGAAGAYLWHTSCYEWGPYCARVPSRQHGTAIGVGLGMANPAGSFLYANKYGKRFMNEGKSPVHLKEALEMIYFDQEKAEFCNLPCFMIFDETYRQKGPIAANLESFKRIFGGPMGYAMVHNIHDWSADNKPEINKGWIVQADTVRGLAQKIQVDPQALQETVEKFNALCGSGKEDDFGRRKNSITPLNTGPYYAVELGLTLINTQGGPKHNRNAQVLDFNDRPIPRLYAAGENGSFFGFLYQGGSNYPEAWAYGRIAGKNAAAEKPFHL